MAEPTTDLLEIVLADVAAAGAKPWYPADYAQATGVSRDQLDASLDRLRLSGLVQLTDWVPDRGQGYTLTPEGAQVLDSPRLLTRLREGRELPRRSEAISAGPLPRSLREPGTTWDRGEAIRAALLDQSGPVVTKVLIWINVAVFAYGLWLASQNQVANEYLGFSARDQVLQIQHHLGGLAPRDLERGQWWRLLSYCFVHGGLLHLLMNMWVLYSIGSVVEKMWGMPRYLLLYLISGLGGAVLHLYVGRAGLMVGASGSICGLLGSMGVWVWLNRRFLPPRLVSDWMRNIMLNVLLIAFISMVPNVSWEGHLGGGLAGAVLAVPLNYTRFGQGAQRWLGWAGVVAVPVLCVALLYQPAKGDGRLAELAPDDPQVQRARERFRKILLQADEIATEDYNRFALQILEGRANPKETPEISRQYAIRFDQTAKKLHKLAVQLTKGAEEFKGRGVAAHIERGREFIDAWARFFTKFAEGLSQPENWGAQRRQDLITQYNQVMGLYNTLRNSPILRAPED
jgi:membrane associated rhomboid family serine protease